MALQNWLNGDNWNMIKTKFTSLVDLLNGGTDGQVFTSNGSPNTPSWETIVANIPGGFFGYVLVKKSSTENDYDWVNADESFTGMTLNSPAFSGTSIGVRANIDGNKQLKGSFLVPINTATSVMTLPVGYRPSRQIKKSCGYTGAQLLTCYILLNTDGSVIVTNPAALTTGNIYVSLDGIFYTV